MLNLNNLDKNFNWKELENFVKKEHSTEKTGHGFDHLEKVLKKSEDCERFYRTI